jgi:dipeptidase E
MPRLVLYSDQIRGTSDALDDTLMAFLDGSLHRIAFLPAATDRNERYFEKACAYYGHLGLPQPTLFDVDACFDPARLPELLASDAIHLGAGDPTHFLAALVRNNLVSPLRAFASRGGVIVGVSAGAMILAPDLRAHLAFEEAVAKERQRDRGQSRSRGNTKGRGSDAGTAASKGNRSPARGLALVGFDFHPHYGEHAPWEDSALIDVTRKVGRPLYACDDGQGIVVDGSAIVPLGAPLHLQRQGK